MEINVRYFGAVAEKTGKESEIMILDSNLQISELEDTLKNTYQLQDLNYKLAINQRLSTSDLRLVDGDELAFLPPFAGG